MNLEPQTSTLKWLFELDDSKSLHMKWLEITKHPLKFSCLGYQECVWPGIFQVDLSSRPDRSRPGLSAL